MALAFAGKTVAASAISTIVRKSFDYLEKYTKAEGMKSVKEWLERTLPQVQVVSDAVDMDQIKEQSEALDVWLWQLRDAVEEAEDVLDEVEYYKLEKKLKSRGNKVSSSIYNCERLFVQQFNTTFKVGTYKRMVDAMRKLDEVAAGVECFILLVDHLRSSSFRNICHHQDVVDPRETSSFLIEETIIGRDTESNQIVEWLIEQGGENQNSRSCSITPFALVGVGGIGKTTLAQAVYNDQRVKQCFDRTMWVCVSNKFDVRALTRKIIQEITTSGTDVSNLNTLQEILKHKLSGKKFFLVFDDVWNDETSADWEKLLAPLKFGQKGSKILLTTRMQSVVDTIKRVIGGGTLSLRLEGLQKNDLLALFNKHAFSGVDPDGYMNLQEIGTKIAKKLSGNPLAAKVMGGLLNSTLDTRSWDKILKKNISNIEHGNDHIMEVLKLSYQQLSPDLKACFRYSSLFNEDYCFKKAELIDLWMGSGLIQLSVDEFTSLEDVGEYYLGILIRKSLFEVRYRKSNVLQIFDDERNPSNEYYVMHDLLHELARAVSRKECVNASSSKYVIVPGTVRHLKLYMENHSLVTDFSRLKKLRTLLISFDKRTVQKHRWNVLEKILKETTKLRALQVHIPFEEDIKLPNLFDNLMHFHYLSISPLMNGDNVPLSVYNLYHLQTIRISNCLWEPCQLSNLVNLRNLRYAAVSTAPPPHIGELTCLQDLSVSHRDVKISELKELKDLRYLDIHGIHEENVEEAKQGNLAEKENLTVLSLIWDDRRPWESRTEEEFLDNLQPHRNLASLMITGYGGSRSPCWMDNLVISHLTYISIHHCVKWQNLPPLGGLPSLKYLRLKHMPAVKIIDKSFYGHEEPFGFRALKLLSIQNFPALEDWAEIEGMNLFPQLETLIILYCKVLKNVPALPSSLVYVSIEYIGLTNLPKIYQPRGTAWPQNSSWSRISCCPNLKQEHYFFALKQLYVSDCENLLHFLMVWLQNLPFLKFLRLEKCPDLAAPQTNICYLPLSVNETAINSCSGYVNAALTSLTTLQLRNCPITTLPSEVFTTLKNVRELKILQCRQLLALDGLEELISLRELVIVGCDKLEKHPGTLTEQVFQASDISQGTSACHPQLAKLEKLRISNSFLLQWEPLRRVNSVENLTIDESGRCLPVEWLMQNSSHLKCLGVLDATHLEFLPPIMICLTSLEVFELEKAMMVQSLSDLPSCLDILHILECNPVLVKRCQKGGGCDWHKIAHIQDLQIVKEMPSGRAYYSFGRFIYP